MTCAEEVILACYAEYKREFPSAPEGDLLAWTAEECGVTTTRVGEVLREPTPRAPRYAVIIPPARKIDPWGD